MEVELVKNIDEEEMVLLTKIDEEEMVQKMVTRFLSWRLPDDFSPDAGISFEPEYNVEYMAKRGEPPKRHNPVGTNLFTAAQAEQMVRYMIDFRDK